MPPLIRPDSLEDALPEFVTCHRAVGAKRRMKGWREVDAAISGIDEENYFAVFSLPDEDYVQMYGDAERMTVEARVYEKDGAFTHYVVGKGKLAKRLAYFGPANGPNGERVWADESQVLTLDDARNIVREFLFHRKFSAGYVAEDVTERFLEDGGGWV